MVVCGVRALLEVVAHANPRCKCRLLPPHCSRPTSRDFLHWRFSNACRWRVRIGRRAGVRKASHNQTHAAQQALMTDRRGRHCCRSLRRPVCRRTAVVGAARKRDRAYHRRAPSYPEDDAQEPLKRPVGRHSREPFQSVPKYTIGFSPGEGWDWVLVDMDSARIAAVRLLIRVHAHRAKGTSPRAHGVSDRARLLVASHSRGEARGFSLLSDDEPCACLNSAIKCTWSILKDVGRLIVRQSPNPGRTISGARTEEHSTL